MKLAVTFFLFLAVVSAATSYSPVARSSIVSHATRRFNPIPTGIPLHTDAHSYPKYTTSLTATLTIDAPVKAERRVSWMSPTGQKNELLREILAGLVVALATIPTSISYSTAIGVNPITGIWNSAIVGLLVTIIGGGPGTLLLHWNACNLITYAVTFYSQNCTHFFQA